jgi:hypothetical protein
MRLFLALLLFAYIGTAFPHSESSNADKETPPREQRGTETKPMVIQGDITTQKSAAETASDMAESNKKAVVDTALVKYAGLIVLCGLLLFVAALIQIGLFAWQLRLLKRAGDDTGIAVKAATKAAIAAEKTLKTTQDTAKKQLRAYLGVIDFGVTVAPGDHGTHIFQVFVEVRNTGQTPAHKVVQTITAEIANVDEPMLFPAQVAHQGSHPLAPSAQMTVRYDLYDIAAPELLAIRAGKKVLHVWGNASYLDIYGDTQLLEFRFNNTAKIHSSYGVKENLAGWKLQQGKEGNSST